MMSNTNTYSPLLKATENIQGKEANHEYNTQEARQKQNQKVCFKDIY